MQTTLLCLYQNILTCSREDEFRALKRWVESNSLKWFSTYLRQNKSFFIELTLTWVASIFRQYCWVNCWVTLNRWSCEERYISWSYLSDRLRFDEHIKYVLTICSQRLYLLKILRGQELSRAWSYYYCFSVTNNIKVDVRPSRLGGFLVQQQIDKSCSFSKRAFWFSYTLKQTTTLSTILCGADHMLCKCVWNPKHWTHGLL